MATPSLHTESENLLICTNCGAQYDIPESQGIDTCRICEDPRQFIPPEGLSFTTLKKMRESGKYENVFHRNEKDSKVVEIVTEPKFGIGQRACLIQTPHGNVMWDCVAYLDEKTVQKITDLGGLKFIIISHPHFYTTWAEWSATFKCPVYLTQVDSVWANRKDSSVANLKLLRDQRTELLPGLTAIICGGHFDGSMILHSAPPNSDIPTFFAADTIFSVTSAHNPDPGKPGIASYSFLWSIPNFIPLSPDIILQIWHALKPYDFKASYGVMYKITNVYEEPHHKVSLKQRLLDSMKIAVKAMGCPDHAIMAETF